MSKSGPIVIVEDDPDDQEMITRIIAKLSLENEVKKFSDGEEAYQYFLNTHDNPLLVISDINMPLMNGIELKRSIDSNEKLARKNMPFVFLTTTASPDQISKAYQMNCQGFFIKGQSYGDLKETVGQIVSYWTHAEHPR